MSVEAMAVVLHHSRTSGAEKLILLGIANHDGDGGAWPKIETLAKYAGINVRGTQRALRRLIENHPDELRVDLQAGGNHLTRADRRPNRYTILITCPEWCDHSAQHRDTRRDSARGSGATSPNNRGVSRGGPAATPQGSRGGPADPHGVALETSRGGPAATRTKQEPDLEPNQSTEPAEDTRVLDLSDLELDVLAGTVAALRPDWKKSSVRTFVKSHFPMMPASAVYQALIRAAAHPGASTPGIILTSGPWWDEIPNDPHELGPAGPFCSVCGYNEPACERLNSRLANPDDGHTFNPAEWKAGR